MSTVATVRGLVGGEFADPATVSTAAIEGALLCAQQYMGAAPWGDNYAYGLALLAGHILKITTPNLGANTGNVGPVTSRSAGDLSESYGSVLSARSFTDVVMGSTVYGGLWLSLRNQRSARAPRFVGIIR